MEGRLKKADFRERYFFGFPPSNSADGLRYGICQFSKRKMDMLES